MGGATRCHMPGILLLPVIDNREMNILALPMLVSSLLPLLLPELRLERIK